MLKKIAATAVVLILTLSTAMAEWKSGETRTSPLVSHAQCKDVASALIQKYTAAGFDCVGMEMHDGDALCFREDINVGVICNGSTIEITKVSNEDLDRAAKNLGVID